MIIEFEEYHLDDDPGRVDRDAAWAFLEAEAYWNADRERAEFDAQVDAAWRVVGAYETVTGRMVGFARAVSDGCRFAYLADVFVLPEARGRRLGVELIATMIDCGPGAGFRWSLHTADAHGLYERFGFATPSQTYLERPGGYPVTHGTPAHLESHRRRSQDPSDRAGSDAPAQGRHADGPGMASSPTAPSPTTATVFPSRTSPS